VGVSADIVAAVARRLAQHAGLELPAWVVEARTAARIAATGLTPAQYVELIGAGRGSEELAELIEAVRVGESRLFRHRSQIAALIATVVPALQARSKRAIRVWSAGCAAGEEPYTLAAVLARTLPGVSITILATDVSADALAVAAGASYPLDELEDVPEDWRDAFIVEGDRVHVAPELAKLVKFERANLVDGATPKNCDIVWCRNVLIYFTPEARKRVIDRLVAATTIGGVVFVGYSESLRDIPELEAVRAGEAVFYVRREPERASGPLPAIGMPRTTTAERGVLVVHGVNRTPASGVPVVRIDDRTPPPVMIPHDPPKGDTLALRGHPSARVITAELSARLGIIGLETLTVDLDDAEMLGDELAQVFRRARAAARAAGITLELRATKPGARRWLARHELDGEDSSP
jgi:chemotaxis methyl-accepting protein methylase